MSVSRGESVAAGQGELDRLGGFNLFRGVQEFEREQAPDLS